MQKPILGSIIALIIHLITPAATHAIINLRLPPPSSPSPSPSPQSTQSQPSQPPPQQCHDTNPNSPHSFTLRQIAYLQYETSPYTPTPQPNTTQLVFEVVNAIDDVPVSTGCACQNVNWADDSDHWYACLDREVGGRGGGEPKYPVKTSVLVEDWEDWRVRIIQTWACDERTSMSQVSSLTFTPTCTESKTSSQYVKECTAPDVVVSATLTTAQS